MGVRKELLELVVCPLTGQRLREAGEGEGAGILRRMERGEVRPRGNADWTGEEVTGFLVTEDGSLAYAVVEGIPVLLPEGGIDLRPVEAER